MSDNIFDATRALATEIAASLFPQDADRPTPPSFDDMATYHARAAEQRRYKGSAYTNMVSDPADVEVGDLVWLVSHDRYKGERSYLKQYKTRHDLVADDHSWGAAVVVRKTAKQIVFRPLSPVCDVYHQDSLSLFGDNYPTDYEERTTGSTNARTMVRMGITLEQAKERVAAHPDMPKFHKMLAKCAQEMAKHEKKATAERDADKALRAPFVAQAKVVNDALGLDYAAVDSKDWGNPALVVGYGFKEVRSTTLLTLLLARLDQRFNDGKVTREGHAEAARILTALLNPVREA